MLTFHIGKYSPDSGRLKNACHLATDNWDDFGFKTLFGLTYYDSSGEKHEIGPIKIGKHGMISGPVSKELETSFTELGNEFFSLGQGAEYYEALLGLQEDIRKKILMQLKDIAFDEMLYEYAKFESVSRGISYAPVGLCYQQRPTGAIYLASAFLLFVACL